MSPLAYAGVAMQCEACGHQNMEGARFCASCGALLPADHQGADPMIGQLVGGRFRVTAVLGEGGMGVVYVGEQQMGSTVRKVAIKTLHQHLSKDPSVLARFHRECGTVAQLEHPNTIKVYDFGSTADGRLYIAMEFVAGRPLADIIRQEGALAPERVVKILRQVCGALDEAHQTGIIHRDLKPDNLILTTRAGETDFVKVLDFGIAARSESADASKEQKLTQQGMVLGTPPYMSPEQFTGKALDARSDVYSLGVMAYEMLTGRLPFDAETPWQWATQHMTAQPMPFETSAPAKHIPPGLQAAILRALAKDREQRPASAREFFAELSDGGRMTVEAAPPLAAQAHTGTAAMDRVPDFGQAAVAGVPGGGTPRTIGGVAMPAPARPPIPPAPTGGRRASGGSKGLIVALGGVGAALLVAMAVVAARSMKPEDEATLANPFGSSSTATITTIAPAEVPPPATADPLPDTTRSPAAAGTAGSSGTGTGTSANTPPRGTSPTTQPKPAPGGQGTTSPGAGTPKPSGGGCDLCASQAAGGQIAAAAASYGSCTDDAKKQRCISQIRGNAAKAAKAAAFNGDCGMAQAIIGAAQRVGAGSAGLTNALNGTRCK